MITLVGWRRFLSESPDAAVYLHPAAIEEKFVRRAKTADKIGMLPPGERSVRPHEPRLVWTSGPTEVSPGISVTGEIPRRTDFEDTGGSFYLDKACTEPDSLMDDQALYIECVQGLVILLGCAHSGVVNTLEHISRLTGCDRFHAVIGGMHLHRGFTRTA